MGLRSIISWLHHEMAVIVRPLGKDAFLTEPNLNRPVPINTLPPSPGSFWQKLLTSLLILMLKVNSANSPLCNRSAGPMAGRLSSIISREMCPCFGLVLPAEWPLDLLKTAGCSDGETITSMPERERV